MKPNQAENRVSGLDSIRFVCAIWVFFGHGAAPQLTETFGRDSRIGLIMRGLYDNIWNGPAAVIVFFVISGFCIHYPFAGTFKRPYLPEFYSRRFLRLLIPVAAAIPLSGLIGVKLSLLHASVLWSLLLELMYYAMYPALRAARLRFRSWKPIILCAYGISIGVILTNPTAGNYPSYGNILDCFLGLPCWLLGCSLAETARLGSEMPITSSTIWLWRFCILSTAWVCSALRFHSPIGYPWTLNFFALLVTAWLIREIAFRRASPPAFWLEWAGLWSYSLYLLHPAVGELFARLFPPVHNELIRSFLESCFVLGICYGFYLLIERPSHVIARWVSKRFRQTLPVENVAVKI